MQLRRSIAWLAVVGLVSCGPESTELEPAELPVDVDSVGSVEEGVAFTTTALATFDATLQAPKCGSVVAICETGTLVQGRGSVGPETNAPNTINDACADGNAGIYQIDESLEGLKVSTVDGTAFAPGKQVNIEARVFAYSPDFDSLDLYYAANANTPSWVLIGTLAPAGSGAQTLQATYTLPSGSLQAIRGVFRSTPTASPCGSGAYDDRDDLVFAVGNSSTDTTRPTTSLTAPAAGATLSGTVTVSASASDNVGVTRVEFYAGTTLIGTDTTAPYSISWNTTTVTNGSYSLTSRAFDAAGNMGVSAARSVTVSNATCGTSQNLLANPGFESGNVSWAASPNVIGNSGDARTGSWRAKLGGNGLGQSFEVQQQITIPATACTATLRFWLKITTTEEPGAGPWDTFYVQILDSTGILLETLAGFSNLDAGTGYVQRTYDLRAYKGQTIRISLNATEDYIAPSSFFVDDTAVAITR